MVYDHEQTALEKYILKMMVENELFLKSYATKISKDIFSKDYRDLAKCVLHYFKEKGKIPNRKILEELYLPKVIPDADDRGKVMENLNEIYSLDVSHGEIATTLKQDINQFIQERHILNRLVSAYSELTQNKDKNKCLSTLKEAFEVHVEESLGLDYFEDLEARAKRLQETAEPFIPTGLKTLDELLGGGYRKKALYVFAGPANSGKSLILNDAAATLAMKGFNVLYVCLELSEDYIAQRTDAKFGEIQMNLLNANPVDGVKKAMAKLKVMKESGKNPGTLWYKEWSPNAARYTDIVALMRNVENKKGIKFDFVVIDYLKLLNAAGKVYGDSMYSKLTTVCEEVRRLAMEEGVCVLSASQTNRESYTAHAPGMENLSDSIGIAQTADCIVTISMDASLNKEDMVLLSIVKSRFSKRGTSLTVKYDFDYMKLVDISDGSQFKRMVSENIAKKEKVKKEKDKEEPKASTDDFGLSI